MMIHIWHKDHQPWLHFMHLLDGIGLILGPLLTQPFLHDTQSSHTEYHNVTQSEHEITTPVYKKDNMISPQINFLIDTPGDKSITYYQTLSNFTSDEIHQMKYTRESDIWCSYAIVGGVSFLITIGFLVTYFKNHGKKSLQETKVKGKFFSGDDKGILPHIILLLDCIFVFLFASGWYTFNNFATVYVCGSLGWSKSTGATLTSVFSISYSVPKCWTALIIKWVHIDPVIFLWIHVIIISVSVIPLFFSTTVTTIWCCTIGSGVGMSILFVVNLSWMDNILGISSKLGTCLLIAFNVGFCVSPSLVGLFLGTFGEDIILYLIQGNAILILIVLCLTHLFTQRLKKIRKSYEGYQYTIETVVN